MIIHKLILQHLKHRDDEDFYAMQARAAIDWIKQAVPLNEKTKALDVGCGHGVFGGELMKYGCKVEFADDANTLVPELQSVPYHKFNLDEDDLASLGEYDLVICSNVLEHLSKPDRFLSSAQLLLRPKGVLYLSWTNWLSPWGGHEFSPFHYFGVKRGHLIHDRLGRGKRNHTPFENLFPTYIGSVLKQIRRNPALRIRRLAPRYYTEFAFIPRIPIVREFLTWNCAVLIERVAES